MTKKLYCVREGHKRRIFTEYADFKDSIENYPGAVYKIFDNDEDAHQYMYPPAIFSLDEPDPFKGYEHFNSNSLDWCHIHDIYEPTELIAYVDGCCYREGQTDALTGIAVYWSKSSNYNIAYPTFTGPQTINFAELTSVLAALQQMLSIHKTEGVNSFTLVCDSQYVTRGITEYSRKWCLNGWRTSSGTPVKNQNMIKTINHHINALIESDVKLVIAYVAHHTRVFGNEMADYLARKVIVENDTEHVYETLWNPLDHEDEYDSTY
ncbi:hypothetical protein DASB73_016560 [Starmerella bacillaris]|uniref:Ribonuclease H n=1 Tax=Starmerella bacillaris TaxID=1247836 RepID=A0AAV5RIY7_STABA|nr:hypothetical protein DASB73_016560 [Starmerella bacillaris]